MPLNRRKTDQLSLVEESTSFWVFQLYVGYPHEDPDWVKDLCIVEATSADHAMKKGMGLFPNAVDCFEDASGATLTGDADPFFTVVEFDTHRIYECVLESTQTLRQLGLKKMEELNFYAWLQTRIK